MPEPAGLPDGPAHALLATAQTRTRTTSGLLLVGGGQGLVEVGQDDLFAGRHAVPDLRAERADHADRDLPGDVVPTMLVVQFAVPAVRETELVVTGATAATSGATDLAASAFASSRVSVFPCGETENALVTPRGHGEPPEGDC